MKGCPSTWNSLPKYRENSTFKHLPKRYAMAAYCCGYILKSASAVPRKITTICCHVTGRKHFSLIIRALHNNPENESNWNRLEALAEKVCASQIEEVLEVSSRDDPKGKTSHHVWKEVLGESVTNVGVYQKMPWIWDISRPCTCLCIYLGLWTCRTSTIPLPSFCDTYST